MTSQFISTQVPAFSEPLHPDSCIPWPSQIIFSLWRQTRAIDSSSQQVEEPCSKPVSKIVSIYRREGLNRLCETCRLMTDLGRWRVLGSIGEQGDPHTKDQTETLGLFWEHTRQTHTRTHTYAHRRGIWECPDVNAVFNPFPGHPAPFVVGQLGWTFRNLRNSQSAFYPIPAWRHRTQWQHCPVCVQGQIPLSVFLSLPPLSALLPLNCDVPKTC